MRIVSALMVIAVVAGCGSLPRTPVPVDHMLDAQIPGMPGIRSFGMKHSPAFQANLVQSIQAEREDVYCTMPDGTPGYCVLALSGGGATGAFGAGFLNGWSASGSRPPFKLVTGISTGALIAPFAFLGPDYDPQLKEAFTTIESENIFIFRGLLMALASDSFAKTAPLADLIERYIDKEMLQAVAAAHAAGRRLFVGTTNLDAQRFLIWNMGAIAASEHSNALKLFRDVVLASASIPAVFPPVMIEVEVDGHQYDEMHADGGTVTQVFFYGNVVDFKAARESAKAAGSPTAATGGRVYVIRNAQVRPEREQVERSLVSITPRTLSTMIKAMAFSDLNRIYGKSWARGIDFNYVAVPDDFVWQGEEEFDRAEMNRLYEIGYRLGKSGDAWSKTPPGFNLADWPSTR
ncbi:MAG: patatin-like phospholipase family protein [Kiloniellales bacterium]